MNKAKQTINNISKAKKLILVLIVQFMLFAPLMLSFSAFAQTEVPPDGTGGRTDPGAPLSQDARSTDDTVPNPYEDADQRTTLIRQAAEQNTTDVIFRVENDLAGDRFVAKNDVFFGLHKFWEEDIVSNLFHNIGQLIGKWVSEFINGWVSDTVQFLTGFLRVFVLNPNIAINGIGNSPSDDISPWVRQGADVMYGIAVDLLLLLFILCIWKYWADAAWRGGGNLMGAVGRLIFTAGLMLAWPTIYAFEIQITNEMIKAVFFNSADQVGALDAAMAAAVKAGLMAGAGLLANVTAGVSGQAFGGVLGAGPGGLVLGTVGGLVAWVGLIIYLVLGGILIAELIYILVLKAIQTALLTAQYMFAPIFLVFFATPDTENVTAGFVRSFVEVSLWTFVWVGLLKIMTIIILSDYNPWGKILMAVGVLQLMIQVPSFLARAQISPMSDFISAGLITGGLLSAGKALSTTLQKRSMQLADSIGGKFTTGAARGPQQSTTKELNNLPNGVANQKLFNDVKRAGDGKLPTKMQPPAKPLEGIDKNKDKNKTGLDANGKPLAGADNKDGKNAPPKKDAAALANQQGKNLNAAGANAGRGSVADGLKKGLGDAAKGVGIGAAAGTAMAGMGAAGALGKTTGTGAPGDKASAASLEQAANAAKEMANLQNAGVVPGAIGSEGKDKEDEAKGEKGVKTDVHGKVLNTAQDGDKAKKGDAKTQTEAKTAAALATALGAKALGDKSKMKGVGAGADQDRKLTVNGKEVAKGGQEGKAADGITPPSAKDLESLNQGDKDGLGAKSEVPKGSDQSIDMEREVNADAAQQGPGMKTSVEAGKMVGAGDLKGTKSVKAALMGATAAGALAAASRTIKGAGPNGAGLDATPQKPGAITAKQAKLGPSDPVSDAQKERAGAGIVEGNPDITATGREIKPPTSEGMRTEAEVDMAKVQEGDQKSGVGGAAVAAALPLMMGAALKGAMSSKPSSSARLAAKDVKANLSVDGAPVQGPPMAGAQGATTARLNTATGNQTSNTPGDTNVRNDIDVDKSVTGQVIAGAEEGKPLSQDLQVTPQVDGASSGLKTAAAAGAGAAIASSLLRGGKGQTGGQSANLNQSKDVQGAIVDAGQDGPGSTTPANAAAQAVLRAASSGLRPPASGGTTNVTNNIDIDRETNVSAQLDTEGNQPPQQVKPELVGGSAETLRNAAAAGAGAAIASSLLRGGKGVSPASTRSTQTDVQGAIIEAGEDAQASSGVAARQAVIGASASSLRPPAGSTNVTNNLDVDRVDNLSAQLETDAAQPPSMQAKPELVGSADALRNAAAAGAGAVVASSLLRGGKGVSPASASGAGTVNVDVDDRDNIQVNQTAGLGQAIPSLKAQPAVTQATAAQVSGIEAAAVAGETLAGENKVEQKVEMANASSQPGGSYTTTETVTGRIASPPPRLDQAQNSGRTVDMQGQQGQAQAAAAGAAVGAAVAVAGAGGGNAAPPKPPTGGGGGPATGSGDGGEPSDREIRNSYEDRYNTANASKPLEMYQQAGYWGIPGRSVVGAIRLAQNTTLGPTTRKDGKAELIGNGKGQTFHVRTGEGHNEQQQAMQIMSAGYAGLVGSDPAAYDAARASAIEAKEDGPKGMAERMASGIMAYNGGSWSQTANAKQRFQLAMYNHAVEGSQAYVGMQSGNDYTQYLTDRYGPMTSEKQAFGAYTTTNAGSPESAWNWAHIPATETLVQNSIPISGMSRAVAANLSVQKSQPWLRGAAIRGGISYMEGMVAQELPAGTDPMVRDAYVGRAAQMMSPAVVSTFAALAMEVDENAASDVAMVNKVASVVGPGKQNHEYVDAYYAYSNGTRVANSYAPAPSSGPSASGGSTRMAAPSGGSAPVSHTISSSGGPAMGGGGYVNEQSYDVEMAPGSSYVDTDPRLTAADIRPGTVGGGPTHMRTNVNLTEAGGNAPNIPPAQKMRFEAPVSQGRMQNDVQFGQYRGASHGGAVETHVEGEIIRSGSGSSGGAMDANSLNAEVSKMVAQYGSPEDVANKVIVDMKDAGFTFDQISNENAFRVAMQVTATDPSMMQAASIATEKMGANNVGYEHVTTVQAIMDADPRNNPRSIESSTIFTAQAIGDITEHLRMENPDFANVSMPPTQNMITALGQHDDFIPRATGGDSGYKPSVIDFLRQKMQDKLDRQNGVYRDPRGSQDSYAT